MGNQKLSNQKLSPQREGPQKADPQRAGTQQLNRPGNSPENQFKRKYPRRFFSGAMGVLYKGVFGITQSTSLGEGGLAFYWPTSFSNESHCVVTFKVPGNGMLSVHGVVKNSKAPVDETGQYVIGIQFLPLGMADRRRIRTYVSSRSDNEPLI